MVASSPHELFSSSSRLMGVVLSSLRARRKLKDIPGPFVAKWTRWWLRGRNEYIEDVHKRYGNIVRIGPRDISVNDGVCLRDIYAASRKLNRPDPLPQFHMYGSENLVSTVDGDLHQLRRRPLRTLYSKRAIESGSMQALFATTMQRLCASIDESVERPTSVDLRRLLRWTLCDVVSNVVYGHKHALNLLGDLEQRAAMDVDFKWQDDTSLSLNILMSSFCPSTLVSLRKNKIASTILSPKFPENLHMRKVAQSALDDALQGRKVDGMSMESLLERLVDNYYENGPSDACPDMNYVLSDCLDHFWAGVITTADALSALVYELSLPVNGERQRRLREELLNSHLARPGEDPLPALSSSKTPEYLDCVIRETLRLYPPISVSLERQVTAREGSIEAAGHSLTEGTTVGAQAFSVHRNPDAFPSPEMWQPERWEADPRSDLYKLQKRHFFAFGSGPRMCIGMGLAESVMRHTVTAIYGSFGTSLGEEWFDDKGQLLDQASRKRKDLWPKPGNSRVPLRIRRI